MGAHPDVQDKVVAELDSIFKGSDRPCTFQDTLEMKYLERCLMEALRMFPPVPMIARQIKEEVVLRKYYQNCMGMEHPTCAEISEIFEYSV